jgi:predicted nucleic acid-binding protein
MEGREYTVPTTKVLHLAAVSACSAYDCEFVAVAETLQVPLLTVDRQLLTAFPSIAMHPKAFCGGADR